jgi:hypothetical protein
LELLPTHLYPQPWLRICMVNKVNNKDVLRDVVYLPAGDPYALYRDITSWYRLFDPKLIDPARKHAGSQARLEGVIRTTIDRAEQFHRHVLDTYYHPNTYAFYAADPEHRSFGSVSWVARDPGNGAVFTETNLRNGSPTGYGATIGRRVRVENRADLNFVPAQQDVAGDGTVPHQSGRGPDGKIRQLFEIRGFDHQSAFNDESISLLTRHLIVKLVQSLP